MPPIPPFSNMSFVTSLSGSTGANMYKNTTDKKWVIKRSKKGTGGFEQVKIESVANDIYEALGIPVPKHFLDIPNRALILEYIDGKSLADATEQEQEKVIDELQEGFIVDALLANWDVIGLLEDNILIPSDGSPAVRIDNGGSLTIRAQGGNKPFGPIVAEIDTMRDPSISPQAANIFGDLTNSDIDNQIKTIIKPNRDLILSLTPYELKETMKARLDNLIERIAWANALAPNNAHNGTSANVDIPLNEINTSIIQSSKNNIINMKINNGYSNENVSNFSTDISGLTQVNIEAVKWYTGPGSGQANRFLYTNLPCDSNNHLIQKLLRLKFPRKDGEKRSKYNCRIMYYIFINLYNAIQKSLKPTDKPVKLYRGALTWYLEENTDKFNYLSSFSSTTNTKEVAISFGTVYNTDMVKSISRLYVFYVHPKCNFINVKSISYHEDEDEILLNPYNRYIYLNEAKSGDGKFTYKNYAIFPTDLDIPSTYDTFMPWKTEIINKTSIVSDGTSIPRVQISESNKTLEGGKINIYKPITETGSNRKYLTNIKQTTKNMKLIKSNSSHRSKINNVTRKVNKTKKLINSYKKNENINRFIEPLPSFPGKAPTAKEKDIIAQMKKFIKSDKE
jgi:hypothetical protein